MHKIFVSPSAVSDSYITVSDAGDIKHLTRVLRLRRGDEIAVSDGVRWEYLCELQDFGAAGAKTLSLRILERQAMAREPVSCITLYQAVPKLDKMDLVVRRTTELGIKRIVPFFTERAVVEDKGGGRFEKKLERWRRIAAEAAKQCRRGMVPEVSEPMDFKALLRELSSGAEEGSGSTYDLAVLAYENEEKTTLKDVLREAPLDARGADSAIRAGGRALRAALIIGPEGGFSEGEADALIALGVRAASLGKTVLRTENAGPSALAMLLYELEL